MKKNNFNMPLSFDNIAKIIGKENNITTEVKGVVMVQKYEDEDKQKEAVTNQIFKNVFDEWKGGRSVVVGDNKLLTTVAVQDFEITEQANALDNFVVMRVKAHIKIEQDPEYAKEIKEGLRNDHRLKFKWSLSIYKKH